jgi:hypothetical protein
MKTNIYLIISRSIIFRIRNISGNGCGGNKIIYYFSILFFFENRAVYEKMWKNIAERERPQMTIRRMHIACWISKAANTLSEYVIHIFSPLQQWLHERASVLCYTYIASVVMIIFMESRTGFICCLSQTQSKSITERFIL